MAITEAVRLSNKKWYEKNKAYHKNYRQDNKEKLDKYAKEYYDAHPENQQRHRKLKRQNDAAYRLRDNISSAIRMALVANEGSKRGESVMRYLPYSMAQLKEHLESQFVEGMSWENREEWHIDHIIPQSKLHYDNMAHPNFLKCWDLSNLQPLWAVDNMRKGNRAA